jgi:hypothetical protein
VGQIIHREPAGFPVGGAPPEEDQFGLPAPPRHSLKNLPESPRPSVRVWLVAGARFGRPVNLASSFASKSPCHSARPDYSLAAPHTGMPLAGGSNGK